VIVVTGAAGFIGSNVVADLEARGQGPIAIVDWFANDERWRNLAGRQVDAFIRPEQIQGWLADHSTEVTAIVSYGGDIHDHRVDVDKLVTNNINFTVALWDWCAVHQVPFITPRPPRLTVG
jgi:ADP-L-glycero-D-manno-heptose 6-epimerase